MREICLFLTCVLATGLADAELVPALETVQLHRNGELVENAKASALVPYAHRLFGSCSFDASGSHGSVDEWNRMIGGTDYLLIKYQQEVSFTIVGRDYRVREILIPLPIGTWPSYLYGRSGDKFFAFSKFRPRELADVACDNLLGLREFQPYAAICKDWKPSPL